MITRVTAFVAVVVSACAFAAAGSADIPRTGDQHVGLLVCALTGDCSDLTLLAGEPFYVQHGFTGEPCADQRNPEHRFELFVDGLQQHGAIDLSETSDGLCDKLYVFDFRAGLTGTHTFTGCWYAVDGSLDFCGTRIVHFV
jgi:hypothetical protein